MHSGRGGRGGRTGRDAAFSAFMAARYHSLVRTARLLTGSTPRAEDLTQKALLRTYRAWHRIGREEAAEAYTRTTMVRLLIKDRRRRWTGEIPAPWIPDVPEPGMTFVETAEKRTPVRSASCFCCSRAVTPRGTERLPPAGWQERLLCCHQFALWHGPLSAQLAPKGSETTGVVQCGTNVASHRLRLDGHVGSSTQRVAVHRTLMAHHARRPRVG